MSCQPYENAEDIAVVVPEQGLDFDMLAQHVEAERLDVLQTVIHLLVAARRVDALSPIALIEQTALKDGLPVQREIVHPAPLRARKAAQSEVALYAVLARRDDDAVQLGCIRGPWLAGGGIHAHLLARGALRLPQQRFAVVDRIGDDAAVRLAGDRKRSALVIGAKF